MVYADRCPCVLMHNSLSCDYRQFQYRMDCLIGLIVGTLFWGLTVEVNKDIIRLSFGFGIIHRSIPRERIATVTQVRNRWWYRLGIKWTPHGWMWNISGLDAVELTYHNGKKFRIGTDEPEALLEALKAV